MDLGLVGIATQQLNTLKSLVEGFVAIRDEAKLQQLRIELQGAVIGLQTSMLNLLQQQVQAEEDKRAVLLAKSEIEQRLRELEAKVAKSESREVVQLAPAAFALLAKRTGDAQEAAAYFCYKCSLAGATTPLFVNANDKYSNWVCPAHHQHCFNVDKQA